MKLSTRQLLLIAITVLLVAAAAAGTARRVQKGGEEGWAGLSYMMRFGDDHPMKNAFEDLPLPVQAPGLVFIVQLDSPAQRAGLRGGEVMLEVEGVPIEDLEAVQELGDRLRRGDEVTYTLAGGEGEPSREVTLTLDHPLSSLANLVPLFTNMLIGLAFLGISLLTFWAQPRSREALVFYVLSAVAAAVFFFGGATGVTEAYSRGIEPMGSEMETALMMMVFGFLSLLMTALLLHLSLIFPRLRPVLRDRPWLLPWLYVLPVVPYAGLVVMVFGLAWGKRHAAVLLGGAGVALLVILALLAHGKLRRGRRLVEMPYRLVGVLLVGALAAGALFRQLPPSAVGLGFGLITIAVMLGTLGFGFLYALLTSINLWKSYRESDLERRRQVRWPLWGTLVSLGLSTLLVGVYVLWTELFSSSMVRDPYTGMVVTELSKALVLLIPLSFAFGIVKYRLLDIDLLIKKTVIYAGATGVVVALYLGLVGIFGAVLVSWLGVRNQVVVIAATLLIAALFIPVRNRIQRGVDRRFFRRDVELERAEMDQAYEIQRSLLPDAVPQAPGLEIRALWEPARVVSGDYYDVLLLGGGKMAVCIGDVSGKGMPAALLMSTLQAAVKAVARADRSPRKVVSEVRRVVVQSLRGGKFVTFFYALVDPASRRLVYTNAGHNPPMLARRDGSMVRLSAGGSVLGRLFEDSALEEEEVELAPGDRLLLFTDGATEARNAAGRELGEEPIAEILHTHAAADAGELVGRVADAVRRFAVSERQDDLTLVVVGVE